jgi:hypothetical protein
MRLEIWSTPEHDKPKFVKYTSKAFGDGGMKYSNIPVVFDKSKQTLKNNQIVLACGKQIFSQLCEGDTLSHLRGSIWKQEGVQNSYVVYTYSPCDTSEDKYGRIHNLFMADMKFMEIWWRDVQKTIRLYREGYQEPVEDFIIAPTLEQVKEYLTYHQKKQSLLAIDLETTGWKDTTRPFLFGVAHSATSGICIPLLKQDRSLYWGCKQREVEDLIEDTLKVCPQMYQNALFDVKVLRQNGYEFPLGNVKHDTMLLHHTLDSALPHGLDFITSVYGVTPYWKDTLKQAPTKLIELPLEESSIYNLRDCVVLHQILPPMLQEAEEQNLKSKR